VLPTESCSYSKLVTELGTSSGSAQEVFVLLSDLPVPVCLFRCLFSLLFSYPAPTLTAEIFHHLFSFLQASSCRIGRIPDILADLFSELGRHYHLDDFEQLPSSCSFSISSESPPTTPRPTSPVPTPDTPISMEAYKQSVPTFSFCGTFSGTGNVSAARWIKRLEHELSGYKVDGVINPSTYLDSLNMLLTDDAAEWAESHPEAIRLLAIEEPTAQDLANFRSLLCERFPTKAVEISPMSFDAELAELRQRPDETLVSFYKRVTNLMQRVGAKDRPAFTSSITLTLLESAMLDTILRAFIKGISDHAVQREATRGMAATDRSLKSIYNLAEEARRTNLEIQKLFEEEVKSKELTFYKNLAERNMTKSQIDALMTAFHSAATPNQGPGLTFHSDPPQFQPTPPPMPPTYRPEIADRR